jgi:hypothetical protein
VGYSTDLKRELIARQVRAEISELNSPTALQRFGAPFRSEFGEVAPVDSELPILRYIFVHHVRNFPFLDQAREKEFWQDKLQIVGFFLILFEICAGGDLLTGRVRDIVLGIVRQQTCFVFGGQVGGNQASEVGSEMREARGTDDGFGCADRVWV